MMALNTSKTMEKFHCNEIWKATKAECDNSLSVTRSLISLPYKNGGSAAITTTKNENHAESSASTLDLALQSPIFGYL